MLQRHEQDAEMRALCKLSFEGFSRFLMDKDNYAFVNEHAKQEEVRENKCIYVTYNYRSSTELIK